MKRLVNTLCLQGMIGRISPLQENGCTVLTDSEYFLRIGIDCGQNSEFIVSASGFARIQREGEDG